MISVTVFWSELVFFSVCVYRRKVAPLDSIGSFQMSNLRNRKVRDKKSFFT